MADLFLFLGRFHPLVVHLPIGFVVFWFIMECVVRTPSGKQLLPARPYILFLTATTSVLSVALGLLLATLPEYDTVLLARHQWAGILLAISTAGVYIVSRFKNLSTAFYFTGSIIVLVLTSVTGHYGGALTHGENYLFQYSPFKNSPIAKKITDVREALVYEDLIQPIFDSKCIACHSSQKRKGGLRLDTYAELQKGGESGAVIQAGHPEKSELYSLITLPPDNERAMPPEGKKPLSKEEIELIAWWISTGGAQGRKVKEMPAEPGIQKILKQIETSNKAAVTLPEVQPNPARQEDIDKAMKAGFIILPAGKESSFLSATLTAMARDTMLSSKSLEALIPLQKQLIFLDLSSSSISSKATSTITQLSNLRKLHLENTQLGDSVVPYLTQLKYLEYLNMYNTPLSDNGLLQIQKIKSLQHLYLWQTNSTPGGRATLQTSNPQLRIDTGAVKNTLQKKDSTSKMESVL